MRRSDPIAPSRLPEPPPHRKVPARLQRALAGHVPQIYTHPDTLLVAFAFECNLACTFCMVEDALDKFGGTPLATFETFARDPEAMTGITRVILSGGEVTLDAKLLQYVEVARSVPGVEHVRIQTNATRLHDRSLLRSLQDAGVDEFFVSLHGHNAEVCDAVTRRPGSYKAIMRGIEALCAADAQWISNTCIVRRNVHVLPDIVTLAHGAGAAACELWNVWPRVDDADLRDEIVPVMEILPSLVRALQKCREYGLEATVKWFPRCLLGEFAGCCDDSQPTALIDDEYWQRLPDYACLFAGVCADGQRCAGLSHAYVDTHGWESTVLRPNRELELAPSADRRGAMTAKEKVAAPIATRATGIPLIDALTVTMKCGGWRLREVQPTPNGGRLRWEHSEQEFADVWLRLSPVQANRESLAEFDGLALSYERFDGASGHAVELVRSFVRMLGSARSSAAK